MGKWSSGGMAVAAALGVIVGQWHADAPTLEAAGLTGTSVDGSVVTHVVSGDGRAAALVVVDPLKKCVAVYHIHPDTGAIELRSVRTIRWDLELSEYNSGTPLPEDIRKGLERAR